MSTHLDTTGVDQGKTKNDQQQEPKLKAEGSTGRLLHYSDNPIRRVKSSPPQLTEPLGRYDKPVGLWVSVEGEHDWRWWCEAEEFGKPATQLCYEVTLADDASVLHLSTASDRLSFTREYSFDPYLGPLAGDTLMSSHGIRWDLVAQKYDGIVIAPYNWPCRHNRKTIWYYGWDCASGCIWDARAIAAIRALADDAEGRPHA
jgi:hypothetical protein